MSLTRQLDSTAQDFKYGLLASKLAALLSRKEGAPLSASDYKDLSLGARCVRDHLHGAEVLYSGSSIASVTAGSIDSLGLALSPLEKLLGESTPSDKAIIEILTEIETTLSDIGKLTTLPPPTKSLMLSRRFFSLVADTILSSINRARMPRSHAMSM